MHTSPLSPAANAILNKAHERGSTAKTVRGALAFLKATPTGALAGLVELDVRARREHPANPGHRIDFDQVLGNFSHAGRIQHRAARIVAACPKDISPQELLDRVGAAASMLTADARAAVRAMALAFISRRLVSVLQAAWQYRASQSCWAGGEHNIQVIIADVPMARGGSSRAWSRNGKWSGTNSYASLTITERCVGALGYELFVGGLLTVDAEPVGPREYRVVWVEQSRGFELKLVDGWLIRGHHVRGGSLRTARDKARKARLETTLKQRAHRLEHTLTSGTYDLAAIMVCRDDSIGAGNCAPGTDAFIQRFEAILNNRPEISVADLLRLERSPHTLAASRYALARWLHEREYAAQSTPEAEVAPHTA